MLLACVGFPALSQPDTASAKKSEEVFTYVEQMPEFPGGQEAMVKFLSENIHYPMEARNDSIVGKVLVQFTVSSEGYVTDAHILKSVRTDIDNEALRVVRMMPKWQPGKQNGKPVYVRYNLPIKFSIH